MYRISEAARTVRDLPELFRSIHESLGEVLPARNFYIALLDRASGLLSFPYFADERDPTPAPKPLGRGLTEYVLRTRQPLLATPEVFESLARARRGGAHRQRLAWTGSARPCSPAARRSASPPIQTYDPAVRLGPEERDLFVFVSEQIAAAIEARRAEDALRQSEARLRLAIEQVPAVLWTTDEELRFTSSRRGRPRRPRSRARTRWWACSVERVPRARRAPALDRHRLALRGESVELRVRAGRPLLTSCTSSRCATWPGAIRGTVGIAVDVTEPAARRPGAARVGGAAAPGDRPRPALHLREGRRRPLPPREPRRGRGLRHDGRPAHRPHRRGLRPLRGGGAPLPRGRPRGDAQRRAQGDRRGADHRRAGRVRYLQTTKIPFTFSGTGRPAVLGVSIDITERKAAEEALRRAAKEESLTVLAGGVAHDFNNLLAAILGHASLALKQLPAGSAAAAARREGGGRGRARGRPHPADARLLGPGALRRPAHRRQRARAREPAPPRGRAARRACGSRRGSTPTLPLVDADVGQIQQVLMNLVINAAEAIGERGGRGHASPPGSREVRPSATPRCGGPAGSPSPRGRYVSLEVRDDGPGMDPGTVDRIFEPFFTHQVHRPRPRPRRGPRRRARPPRAR